MNYNRERRSETVFRIKPNRLEIQNINTTLKLPSISDPQRRQHPRTVNFVDSERNERRIVGYHDRVFYYCYRYFVREHFFV